MVLSARFGGTPAWWRDQACAEDWGTAVRLLDEERRQAEETEVG
ncbi:MULTISPECIES: hypothetical protein [Bifidobacterium]|nr:MULTISPECIES: hypothetical protein [Bifidobacterium]